MRWFLVLVCTWMTYGMYVASRPAVPWFDLGHSLFLLVLYLLLAFSSYLGFMVVTYSDDMRGYESNRWVYGCFVVVGASVIFWIAQSTRLLWRLAGDWSESRIGSGMLVVTCLVPMFVFCMSRLWSALPRVRAALVPALLWGLLAVVLGLACETDGVTRLAWAIVPGFSMAFARFAFTRLRRNDWMVDSLGQVVCMLVNVVVVLISTTQSASDHESLRLLSIARFGAPLLLLSLWSLGTGLQMARRFRPRPAAMSNGPYRT